MRAVIRKKGVSAILFLLVLPSLVLAAPNENETDAQEEEELEVELFFAPEEIVTSATRHAQPLSESPSAVTVITREQIDNTHCTDIVCLLRQVPEVDVQRVVPMWSSVGARALTTVWGDKTLVLVDGREINVEVFGIPSWQSLPVHLEDIERIEVIRGPGSALYGANAHSMVVSIITRRTSQDAAELFLAGGEQDRLDLHLRLDESLGNWRFHLSGGHETSGHWRIRDRREQETNRLRLRVDHETDSALSALQLGLTNTGGRVFALIVPGSLDDWLQADLFLLHKTKFVRSQLSLELLDGDINLDLPRSYKGVPLFDIQEAFHVFSSNLDAAADLTWSPFAGNLLITGGNWRWITFVSEQNDPKSTHQHRVSVFVHDEQRLVESLVLTAGVRFDFNNITPFAISPRLAGVWRFAENQVLRAAFGQAFRKPSFFNTSLHLKNVKSASAGVTGVEEFLQRSIGNDELGNESVTTLEAGYVGRLLDDRLVIEADLFYNRYRDTINLHLKMATIDFGMPDLSKSVMKFNNTGMEADSVGGSISLTFRVRNSLRLNVNYTLRHSWYVSDPKDETPGAYGRKGDRVAWEPAHLLNISFHYLQQRGLRLGTALHAVSSRDMSMSKGGDIFTEPIQVHSPPHCFVSGFVAWRTTFASRWIELGIRAYNILHVGFRDSSAVIRPDGIEVGGELIGRKILLFLRGAV